MESTVLYGQMAYLAHDWPIPAALGACPSGGESVVLLTAPGSTAPSAMPRLQPYTPAVLGEKSALTNEKNTTRTTAFNGGKSGPPRAWDPV